jgi:mannosyl-oligosaccharide glucosidase
MILPLSNFLSQGEEYSDFLKELYPKFKLWYSWFFKVQQTKDSEFSWRRRTKDDCFACGLDDYPRANVVNEGKEIHLDL